MGGYKKVTSPTTSCKQIPTGCSKSSTTVPAGASHVDCDICGPGYYLDPTTKACPTCISGSGSPLCQECFLQTSPTTLIVCTDCGTSPAPVGYNCNTPCTAAVPNCDPGKSWAYDNTGTNCGCLQCATSFTNTGGIIAGNGAYSQTCLATVNSGIPNCQRFHGNPVTSCSGCPNGYVYVDSSNGCVGGVGYATSCKTGYLYVSSGTNVACEVPADNYMTNPTATSEPIAVNSPDRAPMSSGCLLYLGLGGSSSSNARCAQCPSGKILTMMTGSPIPKYTCETCPSIPNCALVVSHNGNCRCGGCGITPSGTIKLILPDNSGCKTCSAISGCTTHTLRLENGNYKCVCSACDAGKHLASDFKSCIDCSSTMCSLGTSTLSNNNCACTCSTGFLINAQKNGCIVCSNSQFQNCSANSLFLKQDNTCDCLSCPNNYIKNSANNKCLDCAQATSGAITHCKVCTENSTEADSIARCTECQYGYILDSNTNSNKGNCVKCGDNCKTCILNSQGQTFNTCTECNSGYVVNSTGNCVQCPTNCNECRINPDNQSNTLCLQFACSTGGLVDSDFTCESCPSSLGNCAKCVKDINNKFICILCSYKTYLDKEGSCKSCVNDCSFCADGNGCLPNGCSDGYIRHRTAGICVPCTGKGVKRCVYQTPQDSILIPKICYEGYFLNTAANPHSCDGLYQDIFVYLL